MKHLRRLRSALRLGLAEHIQRDSLVDMRVRPDAINGFLHLAVAAVAPFDRVGGRRQQRVVQERQGFFQVGREQFLERLAQAVHDLLVAKEPDRVVIETGRNSGWVYDLARALDLAVEVANTNHEIWRWRLNPKKNDREDALKLARLSALGQLPTVHIPEKKTRQWRSLIEYRQSLVERRTAIKNSIRSILERKGISWPQGKSGWTKEAVLSLGQLGRSWSAVTAVLDDSVVIGRIEAGATATSSDTFRVAVDRGRLIEPGWLTWELEYYAAAGQQGQGVMMMSLGAGDLELPARAAGDISGDGVVDGEDLAGLAGCWLGDCATADVAPAGGDGVVNLLDLAVLAEGWGK